MAFELYSKEVAVEVNMGTSSAEDWKLLVCVISKSLSQTLGSVTINNDCTGDFVRNLPTDISWQLSFDGHINQQPTSDEVGANEVLELQKSRDVKEWRFRSLDGNYYRKGPGFISQCDETGSAGEYMTYSCTITGSDELETVETT